MNESMALTHSNSREEELLESNLDPIAELFENTMAIESSDYQNETHPDTLLYRVQFLFKNISPLSVESKSHEVKETLEPNTLDGLTTIWL